MAAKLIASFEVLYDLRSAFSFNPFDTVAKLSHKDQQGPYGPVMIMLTTNKRKVLAAVQPLSFFFSQRCVLVGRLPGFWFFASFGGALCNQLTSLLMIQTVQSARC